MNNDTNYSKETQKRIFRRDNFCCSICGHQVPEVILRLAPLTDQPASEPADNDLATFCLECYNIEHDTPVLAADRLAEEGSEQFLWFMEWCRDSVENKVDTAKTLYDHIIDISGMKLSDPATVRRKLFLAIRFFGFNSVRTDLEEYLQPLLAATGKPLSHRKTRAFVRDFLDGKIFARHNDIAHSVHWTVKAVKERYGESLVSEARELLRNYVLGQAETHTSDEIRDDIKQNIFPLVRDTPTFGLFQDAVIARLPPEGEVDKQKP